MFGKWRRFVKSNEEARGKKKEKRERGFNQCEEILSELENSLKNTCDIEYNVLIKVRDTERQTKLKKKERLKNVSNSMIVTNNELIKGRTVIIFDDVFTTLSTFEEARRALNKSGAKKILGLFIAH